jgi:hypothetical protein
VNADARSPSSRWGCRDAAEFPRNAAGQPTDPEHLDSLVDAYRGVDTVVVQLPLEFSPHAVEQAHNVLDAITASNVPQVIFNVGGPMLPELVGVPYLDARTLLARELPARAEHVTIVGPAGTYMELSAPGMLTPIAAGRM